jgi:hypothetical protein
MIPKKLVLMQIALLAYCLTLVPCGAQQSHFKAITTKTSVNDGGDPETERNDRLPHLPPPSDAELARIAELKTKFLESTSAKMTELHSLNRQLQLSMTKTTIDRVQILQLQSRINAIHGDLVNSRLSLELEIMESMPAEAKERMRKHRLFNAAFGLGADMGGPPPPGFGPPPTCPPPGFGHPPGLPPFGLPPGQDPGVVIRSNAW